MIRTKNNFFHPHLRLPEGETEDSIYQYLLPFCVEDGNREEMQNYLKEHLLRLLYTYSILPRGEGNLLEIKRILKPNGYLVLTTPNVCRIENIIKLIVGGNIYDPYSKHGIYGRHNREYTRNELFLLFNHAGFEFEDGFTSNVHRNKEFDKKYLKQVMKSIKTMKNREYDLGHYIFIRAKNTGEVQGKKPTWLYNY